MPLLQIILGFAFLIFIHELGHFLVARWCGIRCPQFAIGFGQSLLTFRKGLGWKVGSTEEEYAKRAFVELEKTRGPLDEAARKQVDAADLHAAADALGLGQTEYRLNWIPLGGYVKMVGQEDTDPNAKSKDPASFGNKSAKARAAVLVAGIVMNLIFGLLALIVAFSGGVEFPRAKVGDIAHGSPAEKAGLKIGDEITAVDGEAITDYLDLKMRVVLAGKAQPLALGILRGGSAQTVTLVPEYNEAQHMQTIGVGASWKLEFADLDKSKLKPEEKAQLATMAFGKFGKGDAIVSVNGQKVDDYAALDAAVQKSEGREIKVGVRTGGKTEEVTVRPEVDAELFKHLGILPLTKFAEVTPGSPADAAGLAKGDIVLKVADTAYPTAEEFQDAVKKADGQPVAITVERQGKVLPTPPVTPHATGKLRFLGLGQKMIGVGLGFATEDTRFTGTKNRGSRLAGTIGVDWRDAQRIVMTQPEGSTLRWSLPGLGLLEADTKDVTGDGLLDSARIGVRKTRDSIVQIYLTIGRLFQGSVGSSNINGVIGIVAMGSQVAEHGAFLQFVYFLGVISINLAIMNLLPIPVLDGGHLVFLAYEKITGKPLPEKAQTIAFIAGLSILGALMLYATWNDLVKLLG